MELPEVLVELPEALVELSEALVELPEALVELSGWELHCGPRGALQLRVVVMLLLLWFFFYRINFAFADGHTASNAPDLFRPPKLSGAGPG